MSVVGRLDQYASMLSYEFDETTANNLSITGLGTYYASEFNENIVDIARNGLILNLDAGNISSYPGTGTTWTDLSGNGNNGTLTNGPTYSSANVGYLTFDGIDDYISVAHNSALNASLSMTLSAWINVQSFVINMSIFGKGSDVAGQGGYDFRINVNNQLNLVKYNVTDQTITLSTPLNTNTWYNICAVQSSTAVQYFVNGVSVGSFANSSAYQTTTSEFRVARNRNTIYTPANISNVTVYNRTLTATEIEQNYNALAPRYSLQTTNLIAPMSANVFPPYDPIYDEFGGILFGAGGGSYMRQNSDKSVVVYNEINEIAPIVTEIPTDGLQLYIDPGISTITETLGVGQSAFTTAGTFTFVVPNGVTSISAVVVGGGGGGGNDTNPDEAGSGGGGGGLAYQESIIVTPGESLTVVVGAGGGSDTAGGQSRIHRSGTNLVAANGGGAGQSPDNGNAGGAGGTVVVGVGGAGGAGGATADGNTQGSGGGGAGGYSGTGGTGQDGDLTPASTAGQGGGGGGGGQNAGGGGVGILGPTGVNGTAGASGVGGGAGSGGTAGSNSGTSNGAGGAYGGGGAGAAGGDTPGSGAGGAVRIIWGSGRSYPSTSVADAATVNYIFTLSDLSGNGRTASSVNGATRNASLNGGIMVYDGVNDYMTNTAYKGVTGTAARTSIVWFKSNAPNTFDRIIGWGAVTAAGNKWAMEADSTTFKLHLSTSNGAYAVGGSTTPNIMDGNWHMIAASVGASQTVNDIKLYVDGDLLTDVTRGLGATAINTSSGTDVSFGASLVDAAPEYLNGYTSQVLIYNRQLTDLEIKEVYKTILSRFLI